jgi:hypothetical protein
VLGPHGSLVCAQKPALGQRGDAVDTGQQRVGVMEVRPESWTELTP